MSQLQRSQSKHRSKLTKKLTYTRKKAATGHKGRAALPAHLPVEEVEIHPEGGLSDMIVIGKEITEELQCEPARLYNKRYTRYQYGTNDHGSVMIDSVSERVIDKGIPGAGSPASILTEKYIDHLPLYRQKQRFASVQTVGILFPKIAKNEAGYFYNI